MPATALLFASPDGMERMLVAAGLGAARAVPITWLVPAFGGHHAPPPVRVGLGIVLGLLAFPHLLAAAPAAPSALLLLLAREVLVGLTLGLVVSFFFRAAESAGRITDILRGANMAEVLSPTSEERTSPLGDLALLVAAVLFLELGGLGRLAAALARSYEAVPLFGAASPHTLRLVGESVILASALLIESAVAMAAPVIVAFLLADTALGLLARAAPQIPVYFTAMPLKALGGVGLTLLSISALQSALTHGLAGWLHVLDRVIGTWSGAWSGR